MYIPENVIPGELAGSPEYLQDLLVLQNVSKSFTRSDGSQAVVLKDLSLVIKNLKSKPQIVSLLGPSGVGKTTLLRIIAGLDAPSSGRVEITANEQGEPREVRHGDVGVVFQRYPLFDDLNVLGNLTKPAINRGQKPAEANEKARAFLVQSGLEDQAGSWPAQLSGGQRQRIAILQQLMLDRYFIILDEPFSGLDPVAIFKLTSLIEQIACRHTLNTFIVITHDITSALAISSHVFLLGRERSEDGRPVPGAKIIKDYDLVTEGIAFHENPEELARFTELRKEIKLNWFPKL